MNACVDGAAEQLGPRVTALRWAGTRRRLQNVPSRSLASGWLMILSLGWTLALPPVSDVWAATPRLAPMGPTALVRVEFPGEAGLQEGGVEVKGLTAALPGKRGGPSLGDPSLGGLVQGEPTEPSAIAEWQDTQEPPPVSQEPPTESGSAGEQAADGGKDAEAGAKDAEAGAKDAGEGGKGAEVAEVQSDSGEMTEGSAGRDVATEADATAETEEAVQFEQVLLGKVDPTLSDLRRLQERVRGLVERLRPAVVGIRMGGGQGSGVIVTGDGYILTAAHVVGRKGQKAQIVMPDGSTHSATVLGTDASSDSGMLQMDQPGPWPYVEIGESGSLERGQWLMALGHPGGFDPDRNSVVRVGRLLMEPGRTTLQTDCTLVGGDSGGPLFDLEGRVVGIHSRISRRIQQNYHVSVDIYTTQWDDMSRAPRPNLGLSLEPADVTEHLIIAEIHRDGPAEKAGLKKGDRLLKVNGQAVSNREELRAAVDALSLFETTKVVVGRDETEVEVDLVVGVK